LQTLSCDDNSLTTLDVSGLINLTGLWCGDNKMTSLNVSGCTNLRELYYYNNSLTFLDLSGLSALTTFYGNSQQVNLSLSGSGNNYTTDVLFGNGATFSNAALSYSAGILTSNSNTVTATDFTSPTGLGSYSLTGTLNLTYNIDPQSTPYDVSIGTFDNGNVSTDKTSAMEGETVTLTVSPEQGYELASISAHKTGNTSIAVALTVTNVTTRTFTMPDYDVTIIATFQKTQETLDAEAVEEAKAAIEGESYYVAQAIANDAASVETWLVDTLNVLFGQFYNIQYEDVVVTAINQAVDGTEANPAGTDGSFKFTVTLTIGTAISTTSEIPGIIVATAYTVNTGINNPQVKSPEAWIQNGTLHVGGLTVGKSWSVYNASGALVYQSIAVSSEENVNLIVRGVYFVKSDNRIIKVLY